MLEKLPFYAQALVFAGLSAAIVIAAYTIYPDLSQMKAEIAELDGKLADKQREINTGRAIEQRLPEFEQEIANLRMKLEDVQQILPTDRETGDLLRWIKSLGDQANLDLKSFSPGGLKPAEFYDEFPIEMQVVGRYHDLGLFLDRVSKYSRIINVDNLRIGGTREAGKSINASFTATTFVYSDSREKGGS